VESILSLVAIFISEELHLNTEQQPEKPSSGYNPALEATSQLPQLNSTIFLPLSTGRSHVNHKSESALPYHSMQMTIS
jgi:hypothetical protein